MRNKFIVLMLVSLFLGVGTAFAITTVSLSPTTVNVKEGQSFNLNAAINPQGVKNYTVKLEIKYPAELLEVKSFSFGNGWMALAQPGYDSLDNTNGVLIKTAGYPGGFSSVASFGTINIRAKKSGNAVIQITGNSLALDAGNQNVVSGLPVETAVVITPVVVSTGGEEKEVVLPVTETEPSSEEQGEITLENIPRQLPETLTVEPPSPLLAAISSFMTLKTENNTIGVIIIILIGLIVYYGVSYLVKRQKNKKS